MDKPIRIQGAYENNLKHINLQIQKNKIIVFTGVSGSGKSSLVFDTIAVEAKRQVNETYPVYIRNRMPKFERPKVEVIDHLSTAIVIDQKQVSGNSRSTVGTMSDIMPMIRLLFSRCAKPNAGMSSAYSFNDPQGMCPACSGLGHSVALDLTKLLDKTKSLQEGAILFSAFAVGSWQWQIYGCSGLFDPNKPLEQYSEEEWDMFLYGTDALVNIKNKMQEDGIQRVRYEGFVNRMHRLYLHRDVSSLSQGNQKKIAGFLKDGPCELCHGSRVSQAALASKLNGYSIADYCAMEISDVIPIVKAVTHPFSTQLVHTIAEGLTRIVDIGLGYLHLNRETSTLSGGEAQRLKMIKHLGSSLCGMIYILDEPSTGLHPRDVSRLNRLLILLRDKGNTVLIVEHDADVIRIADEVVDMGPDAGRNGGQVLFQGTLAAFQQAGTKTSECLKQSLRLKAHPRVVKEWFPLTHATSHNLKDVSIDIPKGVLCAISGVAGSGKSSLLKYEFYQRYSQSILIDQSSIGTTSRSTPATYVGVMDDIRKRFAKEHQVTASLFSFNSKGACPVCKGKGEIIPDMAFADPIAITCEACGGGRYSKEALQYTYQGKSILDVLELTLDESLVFFHDSVITKKLQMLVDVGLGYMTLGQSTSTLSGGECQRVKLASELQKNGNIYIMDEPTTGLHMADIEKLMEIFQKLVNQGNTVLVIEHNLAVIAQCDWVIDMGLDGGKDGGTVLFSGTPSDLLKVEQSYTAQYLRKEINND